jgi:hypothetical protein
MVMTTMFMLMLLKSELSISKQMQLLKGESACWANKISLIKGGLEWSVKYFAASVSDGKLDIVRHYIDNQQAHHQKKAFKEEFGSFVRSLGYSDEDLDQVCEARAGRLRLKPVGGGRVCP